MFAEHEKIVEKLNIFTSFPKKIQSAGRSIFETIAKDTIAMYTKFDQS